MNSKLILDDFRPNGKEFRLLASFHINHYVFITTSICFSIIGISIQTLLAGNKVIQAVLGLAVLLLMWCLYKALSATTEESVLVLKGVGFQVITKSLWSSFSYFIDMSRIHDVVINEGVIGASIFCYLAILLKDDNSLAFSGIHPLFLDRLILFGLSLNTFLPMRLGRSMITMRSKVKAIENYLLRAGDRRQLTRPCLRDLKRIHEEMQAFIKT